MINQHEFLITAILYSEAGALTDKEEYAYASTAQQARTLYKQFDEAKYETVDEEGNVTIGNKKYKVYLSTPAYKQQAANWNEVKTFLEQYKA